MNTEFPTLTPTDLQRYSRHLILPEVGMEGQRRLKGARVLLVGVGGLGCPAALYLAAAGVGRIGLIDDDAVDASNLQRQVLFRTEDVGLPKVERARDALLALNPGLDIVTWNQRLSADNALDIIPGFDLVVDGADNFPTRYLVNDACVLAKRPNIHGSISRFAGQVSVYASPGGPCHRCLYPQPPPPDEVPNCAAAGVLGVLPGIVGTIQATEAIKLILRQGTTLAGRVLLFNALEMRFQTIELRRDPSCPLCGDTPTITRLTELDGYCETRRETPREEEIEIDAARLRQRLSRGDDLVLLDVREPYEVAASRIDGSVHIPLGSLPERAGDLDPAREHVIYCHAGIRSLRALEYLRRERGFQRVKNLTGGMLAWERE